MEINNYLKNNSDVVVREIEKSLETLKNNKTEAVKNDDINEEDIRNLVAERAPILLSLQALNYTEKLIEKETKKGVLPPNIKDVFLEDLLKRGICICGNDLNENRSCRDNLEKLLSELMPSDVSAEAINGKYAIRDMIERKDFKEIYTKHLKKRFKFKGDLDRLTNQIESKSDELSRYDVSVIRDKENRRIELEAKIAKNNFLKGKLETQIQDNREILAELEHTISQVTRSEEKTRKLQEQKDYVDHLKTLMDEIKESIVDEVRSQLEQKTKEYFFNMIWKREAFSDVQIIDLGKQYKISVKSEFGNECLGDLSAGEKQVLALSFTAALYSLSGYSVPVIIDTPLGRISGAPRDNIASSLPNYLSQTQVIMLMTDTEYTESVRDKIKTKVGMEYKIYHDEINKSSKVINYE